MDTQDASVVNSGEIKSGKKYAAFLKEDMGQIVEQLPLEAFQKRMIQSRWLDQVVWMEVQAGRSRGWYYFLRLTAIIGGIFIPILVTISQVASLSWVAWLATGIGAIVAVASGMEEFFQYGNRWRHYRNTVELLKAEGWQFFQLTGPYRKRESHTHAHEKFAARVEEIIQHDVQTYISEIVGEQEEQREEPKLPVANE